MHSHINGPQTEATRNLTKMLNDFFRYLWLRKHLDSVCDCGVGKAVSTIRFAGSIQNHTGRSSAPPLTQTTMVKITQNVLTGMAILKFGNDAGKSANTATTNRFEV